MAAISTRNRTTRIGAIAGIGVVAAVLLFVGFWVGLFDFQPRTVASMMENESALHPVEATSELCADVMCVEGWRTDVGNYLRFETTGHAEYWATIIGDQGRRYKKIVLDMSDVDLSREQRRLAIDILFSPHDW
jgi:hypothetical protein